MKQEIKPQDVPKIAIALFVLLTISGAGWMKMQGSAVQEERDRASLQAKRESGANIQAGDEFLTPAEADEAQNKREDADPNFNS